MATRYFDDDGLYIGPENDEPSCPTCGGSMEWETCEQCGGAGRFGHDCGEDTCCCLEPEENEPCETCEGHGGWYRCLSAHEGRYFFADELEG